MKTLSQRLNIYIHNTPIVFGSTSFNVETFNIYSQKSYSMFDNFCRIIAEANIDIKNVDDHDFDACMTNIDYAKKQAIKENHKYLTIWIE